jgi:hypothetical protein
MRLLAEFAPSVKFSPVAAEDFRTREQGLYSVCYEKTFGTSRIAEKGTFELLD